MDLCGLWALIVTKTSLAKAAPMPQNARVSNKKYHEKISKKSIRGFGTYYGSIFFFAPFYSSHKQRCCGCWSRTNRPLGHGIISRIWCRNWLLFLAFIAGKIARKKTAENRQDSQRFLIGFG